MNGCKSFLMVHSFWIFPSFFPSSHMFCEQNLWLAVAIIPQPLYKYQMLMFSIPAIHFLLPLLQLPARGLHPGVASCIHMSIQILYMQCFPYVHGINHRVKPIFCQLKIAFLSDEMLILSFRGGDFNRIKSFWWNASKVLFYFCWFRSCTKPQRIFRSASRLHINSSHEKRESSVFTWAWYDQFAICRRVWSQYYSLCRRGSPARTSSHIISLVFWPAWSV